MNTYTFAFNGRNIAVKAKKAEAERIARQIKKVAAIHQYRKEITGKVGGESHEWITMALLGPSGVPIADPETYRKDLEDFTGRLPDLLTPENVGVYLEVAEAIFQKHLPVVDNRRTPEEIAESAVAVKAMQEKCEAEEKAWRDKWCLPELVSVPSGHMTVFLEMNFDDSYTMTDYFHPHAGIGPDMLLAIVPKQAQTERLARRVLAAYPELVGLKWEWHTENYSMGHGNYLMSEPFDKISHHAYDGRTEVSVWWEIRFNAYEKELYPYKGYPGAVSVAASVPETTVRRNEEHNGIEVVFPVRPSEDVLGALKSMGFRWSRPQGLWYAKYSDGLYGQVQALLGRSTVSVQ